MLVAIALLVATAGSMNQEPPTDADVLRAIPQATRGLPFVVGEFRDDITIVKNALVNKVGPRQFVPLFGPARVVETHWECVAHYTRTVEIGFPFAITVKKPCVTVVYIDKASLKAAAGK